MVIAIRAAIQALLRVEFVFFSLLVLFSDMYLSLYTFDIKKNRKPYSFYPVIGDLLSTREQRKKVKIKKSLDRKKTHTKRRKRKTHSSNNSNGKRKRSGKEGNEDRGNEVKSFRIKSH